MNHRIHQENTYAATPAQVYEILTTAAAFSKMSGGAPSEIDDQAGGAFSCFGGMIHGVNVECVPGSRLVQAWRAKNWEPGVYSMVHFELHGDGDGTRVVLEHAGFPDGQGEHLAEGWTKNYWDPMRAMLAAEA